MNLMENNLIEKCREAEEALSKRFGNFTLFGLFEREDSVGKWDIVVSADWLSMDRKGIQQIVDALVPSVSKEEWLKVSRIVPLDSSEDYVQSVTRKFNIEHGAEEIVNTIFASVYISHAVIITAKKHMSETLPIAV